VRQGGERVAARKARQEKKRESRLGKILLPAMLAAAKRQKAIRTRHKLGGSRTEAEHSWGRYGSREWGRARGGGGKNPSPPAKYQHGGAGKTPIDPTMMADASHKVSSGADG